MLVCDTGTEVGLLSLRPVQRPADMGPELVKADTVSKEQIVNPQFREPKGRPQVPETPTIAAASSEDKHRATNAEADKAAVVDRRVGGNQSRRPMC
jgi:hypothetical protein